jgi:hypothetical protein
MHALSVAVTWNVVVDVNCAATSMRPAPPPRPGAAVVDVVKLPSPPIAIGPSAIAPPQLQSDVAEGPISEFVAVIVLPPPATASET